MTTLRERFAEVLRGVVSQRLLPRRGVNMQRVVCTEVLVNNYSVKDLAQMMLDLAIKYPEYRKSAKKVRLIKTTSAAYYGKGYQDVQNRVPKITNTMADLDWKPRFNMKEALKRIFDAYRGDVASARRLVD